MRRIAWTLVAISGCGGAVPPVVSPPPSAMHHVEASSGSALPARETPRSVAGPRAITDVTDVPHQPTAKVVEVEPLPTTVNIPLPLPTLHIQTTAVNTKGAAQVVSVSAAGPGDVWVVDRRGGLFRAQGGALKRQPAPCPKMADFVPTEVRASSTHLVLRGIQTFETPGVPQTQAVFGVRPNKTGAWRCSAPPEPYASMVQSTLLPDGFWVVGEEARTSEDGRAVPLPDAGLSIEAWEMRTRDVGWIMMLAGRPWERRGGAWVARPEIDDGRTVKDLWVDAAVTPWVVGEQLFAFFRDGRWHRVEVPDDFAADYVHGSGPDDVWMASKSSLYHFDGQRVAVMAMPVQSLQGIVFVPKSGLWVFGGEPPDYENPVAPPGEIVIVKPATKGKP